MSTFVIYNKKTYQMLDKVSGSGHYLTSRAAKGALTKRINSGGLERDQWCVDTYENYRANEPMVETYNQMDPQRKPIPIRLSYKGTHMDPAMDSYHTM